MLMAKTLGERISALRHERGWSKQELARRFGGKNPRTIIYLYESGKRVPGPDSVAKLAEIFGLESSELDPEGEASSPERRSRKTAGSKAALQATLPLADSPAVAPAQSEVFMDAGPLFAIPDAELFQKVLGVWLSLDSHDDRVGFLDHVRGYGGAHGHSLRAKNHRR